MEKYIELSRNLWFVRPALQPFCTALYDAYSIRYFLIEEQLSPSPPRYRLLFQDNGDAFAVYPRQGHGLNDIEATGCIATGCRSERMSFDGREYQPALCTSQTWNGNQEVTKIRRCGSDDGEDDQASGLIGSSAQ
jgi:hypothetical protein